MPDRKDDSLMRSLGEFFGHVWKGVKTDPTKKVVSREVEEEVRETPQGKVVLRRTIVEEVEVRRDAAGDRPPPSRG
jgi:hypothetical protein